MSGSDLIALREIEVLPADQVVRLTPAEREVRSYAETERRNADLDLACYLLEDDDAPTYGNYMGRTTPFDRAFVRQGRPEFRYSRQYILHSNDVRAHDRFLSDHYMAKVPIKDYVDDHDTRHEPAPIPPSE